MAEIKRKVTHSNLKFFADSCIVAPPNEAANEINEHVLAMLEGCDKFEDCEEFLSCDSIQGGGANKEHYPVEFLNSIETSGLPPHKLLLCK